MIFQLVKDTKVSMRHPSNNSNMWFGLPCKSIFSPLGFMKLSYKISGPFFICFPIIQVSSIKRRNKDWHFRKCRHRFKYYAVRKTTHWGLGKGQHSYCTIQCNRDGKKPLIFHPGCLLHMLQSSVHPVITDARRNCTSRKRIEHSKESLCKENCDLKGESLCH